MLPILPAGCCAGAPKATPSKAAAPSGTDLTVGPFPSRHARESGHPGATDTAPEALGPRLRGGDEEQKIRSHLSGPHQMAGPPQFAAGERRGMLDSLEEASVVT